MIAITTKQAYSATAPTHLGAGFRNPNTERRQALPSSVFFSPAVYGGLYLWGALVASRCSVPVFLTPLYSLPPSCLETKGGSFQKRTEDAIMDDDARNKAVRLFSQLPIEKQHFFLIFLRTWIAYRGCAND